MGWLAAEGRESPGEHFKSLYLRGTSQSPIYVISLFVILTHSRAQGEFVLLPLASSLKHSTSIQVASDYAYYSAPSRFSFKGKTNIPGRCRSTARLLCPAPVVRVRPLPRALFSFPGQVRRFCFPHGRKKADPSYRRKKVMTPSRVSTNDFIKFTHLGWILRGLQV